MTTEYAVLDDKDRRVGFATYASLEAANAYLVWLHERHTEMAGEAIMNEASGFAGGNEAWYRWNVGSLGERDGGEKDRTYRVVRREVTEWEDVP